MEKEKCKIIVEESEKGWLVSMADGEYKEFIPECEVCEDPLCIVREFIDGQSWDWKEQHGRFVEDFDIEVR